MDAVELLPTCVIADDLDQWLREDGLDEGDVTSEVLPEGDAAASYRLVARTPMIVCGLEPVSRGLAALQSDVSLAPAVDEGMRVGPAAVLGTLAGDRRTALALERTILNILGRTCGVASLTRRYVDAVAGTRAVITDTRKTMPGLRAWDKYAVVIGGGASHRIGLDDAALFKDNHFAGMPLDAMASTLADAIVRARADRDLAFVEVEVDTLEQFDLVLKVPGVDIVLLDNMPPDMMREAVRIRDDRAAGVLLEASGGITLDTVRAVAESGVDRIALGGLTRDATMLDIGLDA
ncbi:MAG: carboxylating nicotinate-nucleotide diphosphorylase [Phycisphaerales bacterium]|jgi:nicotinate-nucleotide pyrophosphorylase (carboxylating)|nr:carboxylating nicotinate-nucleotide diphosphorylase [Phycisphaerales bacterium]